VNQDPITVLFVLAVAVYLGKLWLEDYKRRRKGVPSARALPGATPATLPVILFAAAAAVAFVLIETAGEYVLGITEQQSAVTWLFLLGMLSAAFIEELIFRGFLVIDDRSQTALVASAVGFSVLFAVIHFHWVEWKGANAGWIELKLTPPAGWWTLVLFLNSLLFYWLRFCKWNPYRSLLPCFAAHMASNVAVFAAKLLQGFVKAFY